MCVEWEEQDLGDTLRYQGDGKAVLVQSPRGTGPSRHLSGSHRPFGILLAYGPPIKRGAAVANATLYDIAPTVLYLQNHPIPSGMDGRVLADILTEETLRCHPMQWTEPALGEVQADTWVLNAEEAQVIEERLRGLGYIP